MTDTIYETTHLCLQFPLNTFLAAACTIVYTMCGLPFVAFRIRTCGRLVRTGSEGV